jgi:protein-S-isoprenylcysteine O-methyltransferase Ste14
LEALFNNHRQPNTTKTARMKKMISATYGLVCYLAFLGTILYAIGFVGNIIVPKAIDGAPRESLWYALVTNAALLLLFALQHSIMARPAFKRWWIRFVPHYLERSTYVLLASLCLLLLMWQWQPIGGVVWAIENQAVRAALLLVYGAGWGLVFLSTILINHFDLFGLRQIWLHFQGRPYTSLSFRVPLFYRFVRHPLYLGFLIAFWSTPVMTIAHLLFAVLTTAYVLAAIRFEEQDLQIQYGRRYRNYKKQVPMLLPVRTGKLGRNKPVGDVDFKKMYEEVW